MALFDPRARATATVGARSTSGARATAGARTTPGASKTPSKSRTASSPRDNMAAMQSGAPSAGASQIFSGATPTAVDSGPAKATAAKVATPSGSSIAEAASGARDSRGVGTKVEAREQPTRRTIDWMDRASNMETASSVVSSRAANEVQQLRQAYDEQVQERRAGVTDAARLPDTGAYGDDQLGDSTVTTPGQDGSAVDTVYEGTSASEIKEGKQWSGKAPDKTLDAEAGPSFKPTVTPGKVESGGRITPATVDAEVKGSYEFDGPAEQTRHTDIQRKDGSGMKQQITITADGTGRGGYKTGFSDVDAEEFLTGAARIKHLEDNK